ncbi:MAG TPA: HAD-IC family P-type ATPase [Acidimicrobiales bacterium]|nr:HAD-IC family P-type ATPase [Acidimicrobiales bacterium]
MNQPDVAEPLEPQFGLSTAEVADRVASGLVNRTDESSSRSFGDITRANILTRFNAIVAALAAAIIVVGDLRDALFALVMVSNAVIGIAQELRSKATLDRLTLIAAAPLRVRRGGVEVEVEQDRIVRDDAVVLLPGDQLVVDGPILVADELSIDESLLTGEADAVRKAPGDTVLSGSFVVAGTGLMRAEAVGSDSYAQKLAIEAKKFRRPKSELERGIDLILRVVTWLIIPAGIGLFLAQRYGEQDSLSESLVGTVAGLVALIPQGLVLLLSMAQAVAVIRLGRQQVLVQQLQAVETLARVTMLATDKTGTLTSGAVVLDDVVVFDEQVDQALAAMAAADQHPDPTMAAIATARPDVPPWSAVERIPFASAYKYSAVSYAQTGAWYLGAPEVLLPVGSEQLARAQELADEGHRVLVVGRAAELAAIGVIPEDLTAAGIVVCSDELRVDAADTIAYFRREKVRLTVISGDNPRTVAAIATRCGIPHADRWIDARELPTDPEALSVNSAGIAVFGRVTPEVKRSLIHVGQAHGEVVAMTGDGVNDTLALKDADLGIAMGAGTSAAKAVAEVVLIDNRFSTLPGVVAEGRRVIANIERVARLFVTKTVWAATFAVIVGVAATSYPILPRQLTVIDALTIGIPGFVLSFQPSHDPARPGFIDRVLQFSVPVGLIMGVVGMSAFAIARSDLVDADRAAAQSAVTLVLTALGLVALLELMRPLDTVRAALLAVLTAGLVAAFTIPDVASFFLLEVPALGPAIAAGASIAVGSAAIAAVVRNEDWIAVRVTAPMIRAFRR